MYTGKLGYSRHKQGDPLSMFAPFFFIMHCSNSKSDF